MPNSTLRTVSAAALAATALALCACASPPTDGALPRNASHSHTATRTAMNKQNALDFYEQFFNQHDLSAADRYIGDSYTQHNPRVANGKAAFVSAFQAIFVQNPQRITRAIAEGDLVALHVHTTTHPQDRGVAIVDIFRFDATGKIVEHWDVIQPVPEGTASGNSMF